jgi:hypothetical protein
MPTLSDERVEKCMDVVGEFLQSREWRKTIQDFVDGQCQLFEAAEDTSEFEFSIGQMEVFNDFRGIVNALLESVVGEYADDMDTFVESLDQFASKDPSGPREGRVQDMVKMLLTFDSFETFALVMSARCGELISGGELSNYVEAAHRLEAESTRKPFVLKKSKPKAASRLTSEAAGELNTVVGDDWHIQVAIAKSLIELEVCGKLSAKEETMIPWATAVKNLDEFLGSTNPEGGEGNLALTQDLTCPLTLELFVDPVTVPCCGKAFEREDLAQSLLNSPRCPLCNGDLGKFDVHGTAKNVLLASLSRTASEGDLKGLIAKKQALEKAVELEKLQVCGLSVLIHHVELVLTVLTFLAELVLTALSS